MLPRLLASYEEYDDGLNVISCWNGAGVADDCEFESVIGT
jgi:hypothetical protein